VKFTNLNWLVDTSKYRHIYAMNDQALDVDIYRWFDDLGTDETDSGTLAAASTTFDFDVSSGNVEAQLRCNVSESGGTNASSQTYTIEFNIGGAGWNPLGAASTGCIYHDSSKLTDGNATTERLAGGGTFEGTSGQVETGVSSAKAILKNNDSEFVYTVTFVAADLADSDSIDFRVVGSAGGKDAVTMTVTPNATITKTAGGSDPVLFRRRIEGN
jgi:hypothetical protein